MKNQDIDEWMLDNNLDTCTTLTIDGKQVFLHDILENHLKEQMSTVLKVVKKVVSEGYKLKQQHFNKDWRNALEDAEELIIKNKK